MPIAGADVEKSGSEFGSWTSDSTSNRSTPISIGGRDNEEPAVFKVAWELPNLAMSPPPTPSRPKVYRLVLTGGPCGGKTTGQSRLASYFENIGWRVFTVPEAATVLLSGGIKFQELSPDQTFQFQKDLLTTLLKIEDTYFHMAQSITEKNVLVICDRGAMDPAAYISQENWSNILSDCGLEQFSLKEDRYNQVVHMVTAADGADEFYTLTNNAQRMEGLQQAIDIDLLTRNVWVGHPYMDIIDNRDCKSFEDKMQKLVSVVASRVGLPIQERLSLNSRKRKWLVSEVTENSFIKFEEFLVKHDYLLSDSNEHQVRIRSRTQNGRTTYTINTRYFGKEETIETRTKINEREYQRYLTMKDRSRATLYKKRRCFSYGNQYYNLDTYVDPLPPAATGPLSILETYATRNGDVELPQFLTIEKEITGDPSFSMFELAKYPATDELDAYAVKCAEVDELDRKLENLMKDDEHPLEETIGTSFS